jgi:antitoxin (DNA-binding transcriptional repressor) of toxin-antitoxin stability system
MPTFTIHEGKTKFLHPIQKAAAGEEIIIATGKKPVARLLPFVWTNRGPRPGSRKATPHVGREFFLPFSPEERAAWE